MHIHTDQRAVTGVAATIERITSQLSRYKILFTFELYCGSQLSFYCSPPPAKPTLLQYYCTTIAQETTPPRSPFSKPYTVQCWSWQYSVKISQLNWPIGFTELFRLLTDIRVLCCARCVFVCVTSFSSYR